MHGLNTLSTFGTHPKDFDPEQVKPVLSNLAIILKWYLRYKGIQIPGKDKSEQGKSAIEQNEIRAEVPVKPNKKLVMFLTGITLLIIAIMVLDLFNVIDIGLGSAGIANLEKSVAILPFKNDSPDEENTYFINGIMEEILTNLQTIKDLRVISRTSCEKYRDQAKSIPEIAKELGINYIVEGSGQKFGSTFCLRIQLIKAEKESHLWAKTFEQEIKNAKDIFRIQSEIAQSIASELEAVIMPREKQLIEKIPTVNLEAYEADLKGQFYLRKFTPGDLDSAMKYFEKAKDIDPKYALAYSGICDVWAYREQAGLVTPAVGNAKSLEAAMEAFKLDSTSSEVQYSLAHKKTWGLYDWEGAESGFKKSISLNPNNAMAHAVYSHLLNIVGRPEEAMQHIKTTLKLDPMNPFIIVFYGMDLTFIRKYEDAVKAFQDAMKIEPGYLFAMGQLAWTLIYAGRYSEALGPLKASYINDPELLKAIEQGYSKGGWKGLLVSFNEVIEKRDNWLPADIAGNYAMLGLNDKAISLLERAYEIHDPNLPYLLYPNFDNLRNDPRFQDLCRRMKLPYK
jgi:TolB-like protein/Tfp pilus assembly protein PilF